MLYAAVLAGGRSSRMGSDKALLCLDGRTLLERAVRLLEDLGAERIFVSGRAGDARGVPDLLPHAGPPGGLYSVLDHLKGQERLDGSPLLLIPVDMPRLEVDVLARLLVSLEASNVVHYEGEVFPCVFRASKELHGHLRELFAEGTQPGGGRSMKALFAWSQAKAVRKDGIPESVFMNINQPSEWAALTDLS